MTFLTSPSLASFADWAEQLIAESTGKEGKGITPVVGEPFLGLEKYGSNRVFVLLRQKGENEKGWADRSRALKAKGFPVIDCLWDDGINVGGEFRLGNRDQHCRRCSADQSVRRAQCEGVEGYYGAHPSENTEKESSAEAGYVA